jgi:two-component system, OmpR family, phosphate regulon response regulator PhoB
MEPTILVIEESLDLCRLFEYMLRADGYTAYSVNDWREAQAQLLAQPPDLIIYDWALANANGWEWAEELRRSPTTAAIPILLICGEAPPRAMLDTIGSVGISMIEKPFDIFMFRNRVNALLGTRERIAGFAY